MNIKVLRMKNSAINIFNDWAKSGRDKGMEKGHNISGSRIIQIVDGIIKNESDKKISILDIGCGNGWMLRKIKDIYTNAYCLGVDGSSQMVSNAVKNDKKNSYIVANLNKWTPKKKFDIIISMEVLYYLDNPQNFIKNIYNTFLKNGGVFVFGIDHYKENKSSISWPQDLNVKMHTLATREWINIVSDAGLRDIRTEQFNQSKDWGGTFIVSCIRK